MYQQSNWTAYTSACNNLIRTYKNDPSYPLILLQVPNCSSPIRTQTLYSWTQDPQLETLRTDEYIASVAYSNDGLVFVAFCNNKVYSQTNSILSICRTIFVCVVLSIASIMFTSDANNLVLSPIERMLEKVKLIAKNPLAAASDEVDNAGVLSLLQKQNESKKSQKTQAQDAQYETAILEKAIVKIGHLLALGFGEAGSKIIASNISQGGDINPMMAGQRVYAIFGFCDIRNFTDSTEILQTKVMLFVNQIAEITHAMVDKYGGSANKNIGDAFLLVWKFKNEEEFFQVPQKITRDNQFCADLALFSFLKIIAKVNKFSHILEYRKDPELNKRMPGYQVKMGFGIHQGWAIEGAIGSMFKIDASYLSPNVNMAARLEAATKQYGVPLLISGPLYDIFTDEIKRMCREIDTVTVKGSIQPVRLFTVDVDFDNLTEKKDRFLLLPIKEKKHTRDQEKKLLMSSLFDGGRKKTWDIYSKDKDFMELRRHYDKVFTRKFNEAYKKYIAGDWATAEDLLSQCLKMNPNDGPTITLKSYIEELNGTPPLKWEGFRELTEK